MFGSIRPKKKNQITNIARVAQPTSESVARLRNLIAVATRYPERMVVHRMIEPSSADHSVATLNGNGVCLLELLATNAIDQSCVRSARSMKPNASNAPAATI